MLQKKGMQKQFARALKQSWAREFPFLIPHEKPEDGHAILFRNANDAAKRWIYFGVQFNTKTPVQFTVNIIVSDAPDYRKRLTHTMLTLEEIRAAPIPFPIGLHRIGAFFPNSRGDFWWHLTDIEGARAQLFSQLAGHMSPAQKAEWEQAQRVIFRIDENRVWRASGYEDADKVISEAIADLNTRLREYVLPQLMRS